MAVYQVHVCIDVDRSLVTSPVAPSLSSRGPEIASKFVFSPDAFGPAGTESNVAVLRRTP